MNRSIALFVALATLLAHVLAIHIDGEGNFAFPYEQAYTAFRLAKSLVQDGLVQWGADGGGVESYPSLVWIGVAAVGERYTNHINLFCQTVAILSGLATVILLSRFHPTRIAGLIAPLLCVSCGAVAAACGSGMEGTLFVLALLAAFWFQEHEHPWLLALALTLLVFTRAEGILFAGLLFALGLVPRGRKLRLRNVAPFAAALAAFLVSAFAWKESGGTAWHPVLLALFEPHPGQAAEGLSSLLDLVRIAPSPVLLVFPLLCIARGRLSGLGLRALLMTGASATLIVLEGRSPLCFGQAFLPALPFLFLAIQEGLIDALDAQLLVRRTGLTSLFLVLGFSALASKMPGDLGPLHIAPWHQAWMDSAGTARAGYTQPLARAGLIEEIENTNRLRAVALFLRDKVEPSSTCLSPWPSAIAYLSHLEVADLLARANPMQGSETRGSWTRRERGDVLAALNDQRDFVVPRIGWSKHPPSRLELAREWARELDLRGNEPGRVEAIEAAFANYELITVPVQAFVRGPVQPKAEAFHLLRHRRIEKRPVLELHVTGSKLHVLVRDAGHEQLVDLVLLARDSAGKEAWVRPTGDLADHALVARSQLKLFDAGQRPIELMGWPIPPGVVGIEAVLLNPGATGDDSFAFASPKVIWAR